jgi:uracil-DNA glycosylase family 4
MSFLPFLPEATTVAIPKRVGTAKAIRKRVAAGAVGCDACPMQREWPRLLTARMKTQTNKNDDILVLGGMPNHPDDKSGQPFSSELGKMVRDAIPSREMSRVSFGNVARCCGPEVGLQEAAHACGGFLEAEIAAGRFKAILAIGNAALQRFAPGAQVMDSYALKFPIEIGGKSLWCFAVHDPYFVERLKGEWNDGPAMPIFKASIKRFFQGVDEWDNPRVIKLHANDVLLPKTAAEAQEIYEAMEGPLGIDLESSELKPYIKGARLLTGAISDGNLTMAFPIDHPEEQTSWGLAMCLKAATERKWIAHNAGMELVWMTWHAHGEAAFETFDDTMAQARLYFERAGASDLGTVSQIILGTNLKLLSDVRAARIMEYPLSEILPYNGLDAQGSALINRLLKPLVKPEPYQVAIDAVQATSQMELMGLTVDRDQAAALRIHWQKEIDETVDKVFKVYEVREFELQKGRKFSISAPADLGDALVEYGKIHLPKTPKGKQYQTSDEILSRYAEDNPLAKAVLHWRASNKLVSTYIDPVEEAVDRYQDALLHPSYTVLLTRTGRLSSNDPNIQNFPKRKHHELRRMIRARFGHIFLALDYGQLEARVIAMASRDKVFCKAILDGFDVHSFWLDECLKIHPDYLDHLAIETNLVGASGRC